MNDSLYCSIQHTRERFIPCIEPSIGTQFPISDCSSWKSNKITWKSGKAKEYRWIHLHDMRVILGHWVAFGLCYLRFWLQLLLIQVRPRHYIKISLNDLVLWTQQLSLMFKYPWFSAWLRKATSDILRGSIQRKSEHISIFVKYDRSI